MFQARFELEFELVNVRIPLDCKFNALRKVQIYGDYKSTL